jgi:phosphonate transport system permease protein
MSEMTELAPVRPARQLRLPAGLSFTKLSLAAMALLVAASWLSILTSERLQAAGFFNGETLERAWRFLVDLSGTNSDATPAYLQWDQWREKAGLALDTLAMSVLALAIAAVLAFGLFMFGARNVMLGELSPYRSAVSGVLFAVTRAFFTFTRSIPELVWAMIIVFAFTPGILPGAIALGLHNAGVIGRLGSEVVEGLDPRPMRSLQSAGAGRFQVLAYGVLPEALPRFVTYLFYRWEVIIRTTVVVGFVSAGGLGTDFRLAMSYFRYTEITLILFWYLLIVLFVDFAAAYMRRLAE